MRCKLCGEHATWEQTIFKDMSPTKVRLCASCQQKVQADDQLARIKSAPDHDAKNAAIDEFLKQAGYGS